jgi:hypothetical protein
MNIKLIFEWKKTLTSCIIASVISLIIGMNSISFFITIFITAVISVIKNNKSN